MASEFKELNNLYTKRPAVALFKKPFANNDEMSNILEGMLDIYASVEQESISKYSFPKYKAIYWNHLTGIPMFEKYGEVVVFRKGSFANDKTRASLKAKILAKQIKDLNTPASVSEVQSVFNESGQIVVSSSPVKYQYSYQTVSGISDESTLAFWDNVESQERLRKSRTFDLWVIDPNLQVILENTSITSTKGANVTTSYLPYLDLFESIKLITKSRFEATPDGINVNKSLKSAGVKSYRLYEVTLKEDVIWETKTSQQVDIDVKNFSSNLNDYLDWRIICDTQNKYLKQAYTNDLNVFLEDNWSFAGYKIPLIEGYSYNIPIEASWFGVSNFFDTYLKRQNISFLSSLKDKLFPGSLVFSSYPSESFAYKLKSGEEIKIKYKTWPSRYIQFSVKSKSITTYDLIEIYTLLCRHSGSSELPDYSSEQLKKQHNHQQYVYYCGYDTPLRTLDASRYVAVETSGTLRTTTYAADPASLYASVLGVARIKAVVKTEVETKTRLNRKLTHGAIPTVLDFKLEYYAKIFEQYIKPKCEKYKEFIESGLMKMYPFDIMDVGTSLLKATKGVQDFLNLTRYTEHSYVDDYTSPERKLELINYFESVLFNNYSGFYTTSTAPVSEAVAAYSNTRVDESNISTKYNDQAAALLSAISALKSSGDIFYDINNISNKDVSSIALSRQTRGKSSASLILKNLNSKYCISTGKNAGDLIFEPMDEVYIYLPTFDDNIVLSFKGFIDSAQYINDKGYHSIGIQASCPMKKLELVRTNVRPSLSSAENSNSAVHPFTMPPELYESIDKWGPFMFMQALTFYSSMLQGSTVEDDKKYIYTVDKDTKLPTFYDTLLQFLWYRQTNAQNTQKQAANALTELVSRYTATEIFEAGKPISEAYMGTNVSLTQVYTRLADKNQDTNVKATYNIFSQRIDGYSPIGRNLVAQLLGTLQPAWVIGSQDINIVFSDYKTNLEILSETADKFNCYLYSDKNGVVQFRPPQISLVGLSCSAYDDQGTISWDRVLKTNDYRYEVRPDMIDEQTITAYHTQCDDSNLVTWLQLSGQNVWASINAENGNAVVIQDMPKSLKYGIKTQQAQILSGIENKDALYIYGLALLDRQNSLYRSGNIAGLGSGDLDINMTMYSPIDNTVYLSDGLTINYSAGGSFTYNMPLKWGRKPLFEIPLTKYGYVDYLKLRDLLLKSVKKYEISDAYYNQLISYLDYLEKYPQNDYILSSFMFNGYVWDGISSISFEDLVLNYFGALMSQDSGLEIAFGINGRGLTEAQTRAVADKAKKSVNKIFELHGGAVLNTVIPNGSNREKQISIYVKQ